MSDFEMDDFLEEIESVVNKQLQKAYRVRADACGLDCRCGWIYVCASEGWIAAWQGKTGREQNRLEYYGGFEYIPYENVRTIGEHTFYFGCERVQDAIKIFEEKIVSIGCDT